MTVHRTSCGGVRLLSSMQPSLPAAWSRVGYGIRLFEACLVGLGSAVLESGIRGAHQLRCHNRKIRKVLRRIRQVAARRRLDQPASHIQRGGVRWWLLDPMPRT